MYGQLSSLQAGAGTTANPSKGAEPLWGIAGTGAGVESKETVTGVSIAIVEGLGTDVTANPQEQTPIKQFTV